MHRQNEINLISIFAMGNSSNKLESGEVIQLVQAIVSIVIILSVWTFLSSFHLS